jgi:hypothetical protein
MLIYTKTDIFSQVVDMVWLIWSYAVPGICRALTTLRRKEEMGSIETKNNRQNNPFLLVAVCP